MNTKTDTVALAPYVMFSGNCGEAIRFYQQVLDAQLRSSTTYGDMPACAELPDEAKSLIVNAQLELPGGGLLMVGDLPPHMAYEGIKGVTLSISYDRAEKAEQVWSALAEGGQVTMPFGPMFWAKGAGMATDKFGVSWVVNGELLNLNG